MARARWRKRWTSELAVFGAVLSLSLRASAEVRIIPGKDGDLGAWLALGPILVKPEKDTPPPTIEAPVVRGADEAAILGRAGKIDRILTPGKPLDDRAAETATWRVIADDGPMDLSLLLGHPEGEAFALLFGVLHLGQPLDGALLIGASDGIKVMIDRRVVLVNDTVRSARDDEELIPVHLGAGDHTILVKLRKRHAPWSARIRIVDRGLLPPRGAALRLPGTSEKDARTLGARMVHVDVDRGLEKDGYTPRISVRFPAGLPEGADRGVRAAAFLDAPSGRRTLFRVEAGEVPMDETGPTDYPILAPFIRADELAASEDAKLVIHVEVAGKSTDAPLSPKPWMHAAVAEAARAAALCQGASFLADPNVPCATALYLVERVRRYVGEGDGDLDAIRADASAIHEIVGDLEAGRDPLLSHVGIRRLAYRSPLDGGLSPFGLLVPAALAHDRSKRYPLVVVLHGMNGKPISVMEWFFGRDDPSHDGEWEDRHPGPAPAIDAFVLAPSAFGNAMYRELGEADVMAVLDWVLSVYPIDRAKVTITGASMGGTGTSAIALHHPDRFAAAEPLCGYHSYFVRADFIGRRLERWERLLAEQRSPALWAENGLHLPLYVWHGKRDLPERNSGVLIDRYKDLGYAIDHEHPDVGHDVWRKAYDGQGATRWLTQHTRPEHPNRVLFKTDSLRWADDAWVHVRELARDLEFGQIDARTADRSVTVSTRGVVAFALDRDPVLLPGDGPVDVAIDGQVLSFDRAAPIELVRSGTTWSAGAPVPRAGDKRAGLSGPIRDVFHEPLVFVYGTLQPDLVRANQEVARAWARIRAGVDARYPIVRDTELDEETAASHSLVLVGGARSNRVVREIEPELPFRIDGDAIVTASQSYRGKNLGVAFVRPNPKHPSRYVLVIEGVDAFATLRSLALPDLLPDWIVYDERIAPARGQLVLSPARPVAAGMFERDWSLKAP
jgi:hypothetical protein